MVVVALLGGRLTWFLFAQITLYEIAQHARIVGQSQVIAEFPASALGRLRPGQPGQIRLDSFPWGQYGMIPATVTVVVSEIHDNRVQVQLALQPDPSSRIPAQHGLIGTAEVAVEHVTPAMLMLRAAGQWFTPAPAAPRSDGSGGESHVE